MSAISQSVQLIQAAIKTHAKVVSLLDHESSNERLRWTTEVAGQSEAAIQAGGDERTRQRADRGGDDVCRGFQECKDHGSTHCGVVLAVEAAALYAATLRVGLRSLKPILSLAGRLLQDHKRNHDEPPNDVEEAILLIKAVRMNTMSKLTFADARRFQHLCVDLFPGVTVKDIEYAELEIHIREAMEEMKLKDIRTQIAKMLQFHEACNQRMSVGVVGPSGCGKSTIWKVLENAYKRQHKKYVVHIMNPQSMARVRLLGHMDHDTREWFDGVLTASARKVIKVPADTHNWIICDGEIDPDWVEALNSILDDNRLPTMPNGERIQFGTNMNFIFERDNLRFASPATVSRLSVIFLSEENVDVKPMIASWIAQQPPECQGSLATWFDSIFHRALDWIYKGPGGGQLATETTTLGMVRKVLGHMVPGQKKGRGVRYCED